MKKLHLLSFAILITICFAFIPKNKKVVILDVSHGGQDIGVTEEGFSEKDITLSIAQKVKDLNVDKQLEIILTREVDAFIKLQDRVNFINEFQPSALISLHVNKTELETVRGFDIYTKSNLLQQESNLLAETVQSQYPVEIPARTIKSDNFFILKNIKCPAMLLDVGFLSNPTDREFITSEAGQWKIAAAIYEAIK